MPLTFAFLWDEDKTRRLFRFQLVMFAIGAVGASFYVFLFLQALPHLRLLALIPIVYFLVFIVNLVLLPRPNPGIRFLATLLIIQALIASFMALSGGLGILQFVPYVVLLISIFQLGGAATYILGSFSLATFIAIVGWEITRPTAIRDDLTPFFLYIPIYAIMVLMQGNVSRDLSLQLETKKRLEEFDDVKNQFMALSSHYLRTPLTVMKGYISQLEEVPLKHQQHDALVRVKASVGQLETVVEKFLFVSSIERGVIKISPSATDVDELIKSVVDTATPYAQTRDMLLTYTSPIPRLGRIMVDAGGFREVILALVDNGLKYNRAHGSVVLTLSQTTQAVMVTVCDTGSGIESARLATLFTPFSRGVMDHALTFTTPGLGMGLYLVKLLVEAHGGTVEVDSVVGTGSTFTVILPAQLITTVAAGMLRPTKKNTFVRQ